MTAECRRGTHTTGLNLNTAVEVVHEQTRERRQHHSGGHQSHHHAEERQRKQEEAVIQTELRVSLTEGLLVEEQRDGAPLSHRRRSNEQTQQQRNHNQQNLTRLIHALVVAAHALLSTLLTKHVTQHLLGRIRTARRHALIRVRRLLRLLLGRRRHISMTDRVRHRSPQRHSNHHGSHHKHGCLQQNLGSEHGAITQLIKPQPVRVHLGRTHKSSNEHRHHSNRHPQGATTLRR